MYRSKSTKYYVKEYSLSAFNFYNDLCRKYGLKNRKEVSSATYLVKKYEKTLDEKQTKEIYDSLCHLGVVKPLQVYNHVEANANLKQLTEKDFLERRLQTLVAKEKNISLRNSRQLITHGKVKCNGITKRFPGYLIRLNTNLQIKS